jgi:hypothetical protein
MLLSKKLYNGIYIYISGISGQIGLPSVFRSGNTHTHTCLCSLFDLNFLGCSITFHIDPITIHIGEVCLAVVER